LIIIKVFSPTDAQLDSLKNNCNFSKAQTVCSLMMVFSHRNMQELLNVNFNANLKLFLRLSNCASFGKKNFDNPYNTSLSVIAAQIWYPPPKKRRLRS